MGWIKNVNSNAKLDMIFTYVVDILLVLIGVYVVICFVKMSIDE